MIVICIANGIFLSVGSAQCRIFLSVVRAELLWSQPGFGTLMGGKKKKKKKEGSAISKVRLVQQSFEFEFVLVTHYGLRGKSIVFCLDTGLIFLCQLWLLFSKEKKQLLLAYFL